MHSRTTEPDKQPAQNGYGKPTPKSAAPNPDLSQYVFGKVQPQAVALEEAVLGALMLDREALPIVMDLLRPESFYLDAHRHIYRAILGLFNADRPVDLLTVTDALRQVGKLEAAGGGYYLTELTNRVASAANIEYHARIVVEKAIKRQAIQVGTDMIRRGYDESADAFDSLDRAEQSLYDITAHRGGRDEQSAGTIALEVLREAERAMQRRAEGGVSGVPSGLRAIDDVTGGWQNTDLVIIAGRPAMGKTAAVLGMAQYAAQTGTPTAFFSLEMNDRQLIARIISGQVEIAAQAMSAGTLHESDLSRMQDAATGMANLPLYVDDGSELTIMTLRAKARRLKKKRGIGLLVVDYLQLMSGGLGGNREQEIAGIARGLKAIAKDLQIPVIALSQLSRSVEVRGGSKRPQLSDLRESGAIEQDADIVAFLYRPEYYGIEEDENGQSLKGVAEFIVAKHRNGPTGTAKLKFMDKFARFSDLPEPTQFPVHRAEVPEFKPSAVPANRNEDDLPF
jgi:replicative DNA helicase